MLEIKLTDPQNMDKIALRKFVTFLTDLIADKDNIIPPSLPTPVEPRVPVKLDLPPLPPIIASTPKFNPFDPAPAPVLISSPTRELDVFGLPWDGRIHSSSRAKINDGSWKLKRGVNDAILAKVKDELMQAMSAAKPIVPVTSPDPLQPPTQDFPSLMAKITSAVNSGKLQLSQVTEVVQSFGLPSLVVVGSREDLIPGIIAKIDSIVGG